MKPVYVDGIKLTSMTAIYADLGAHTQAAKNRVKECLASGQPYNGHEISLTDPAAEIVQRRKTVAADGPLLPGLCTHRLGYNSGRHA